MVDKKILIMNLLLNFEPDNQNSDIFIDLKKENIIVIFSTSRPSEEVFTDKILDSSDLKIAFKLSSFEQSKRILGFGGAEKLAETKEKIIVHKNKLISSL